MSWLGRGGPRVVVLAGAGVLAAIASAPLVAAEAGPPAAGKYAGMTSEKGPVSFTVTKDGTSILGFTAQLGYNGKCGQGGGPGYEIVVKTMPVSAGGTFRARAVGVAGSAKGTVQISGSITRSSATGAISETKPFFTCKPPNQKVNPYGETFSAKQG